MTLTDDPPVQAPAAPRSGAPAGTTAWSRLVAGSALILAVAAVTLGVWWVATLERRTTTYNVLGDLAGIELNLGDADVQVDGGATAVEVRRVDSFAFGAPSTERHTVEQGRLMVVSRCPEQLLGGCRASFRVTVPDNVPIEIVTSGGNVTLSGVRASVQVDTGAGAIVATGFCGFSLRASSDAGDVSARAECSAERLELRSRSGDVHATVPAGRYEVDAQSDTGQTRIRGVDVVEDGSFQIQALSTTGDVTVEAAS